MKICKLCKGYCCQFAGDVILTQKEMAAIARFLGKSSKAISANFIPQDYGYEINKKENRDCPFKGPVKDEDGIGFTGCTIHPVRPQVCQQYNIEACNRDGFYKRVLAESKSFILDADEKSTATLPKDKTIVVVSKSGAKASRISKNLLREGYHSIAGSPMIQININVDKDGKVTVDKNNEKKEITKQPVQIKELKQVDDLRTPYFDEPEKKSKPDSEEQLYLPEKLKPLAKDISEKICEEYYAKSNEFLKQQCSDAEYQKKEKINRSWTEDDENKIIRIVYGNDKAVVYVNKIPVFTADTYSKLTDKLLGIVDQKQPNMFFKITPNLSEKIVKETMEKSGIKSQPVVLSAITSVFPEEFFDERVKTDALGYSIAKESEVKALVQKGEAKILDSFRYQILS